MQNFDIEVDQGCDTQMNKRMDEWTKRQKLYTP